MQTNTASVKPIQPPVNPVRRWIVIGLVAIVLLAGLGVGGRYGWRKFKAQQQERALSLARELFEKKDYNQALLSVSRALQVDPRSIPANRLMAEIAESAGSSQAVQWRRRVVELEPGVVQNYVDWAEAAIRFDNTAMATQALAAIPELERNTPRYHEIAGRVDYMGNRFAESEAHFAAALQAEPENKAYRFGLATAQLRSRELEIRRKARAAIEDLIDDPKLRRRAYRALIQEAMASNDGGRALELSAKLDTGTDAPFEDRLVRLEVMHSAADKKFYAHLLDMQERAVENPEHVAAIIAWLNRKTMALVAVEWANRLPETVRNRNPVPAALAESYANLREWKKLKPFVLEGNWQDLEFMRFALASRALREEGDALGSKNQWIAAVRSAGNRPEALERLARFAAASNWQNETFDLLWQVAQGKDNPEWALAALYREYTASSNTRGLLSVSQRQLELAPENVGAQNNVASLSLLLNQNMDRAQQLAKTAYAKYPENPVIASTYAFALHMLGKSDEGLKIMNAIDASILKRTPFVAYYGVILADAGTPDEALKHLDLADTASLLPEERTIVQETRDRLRSRSAAKP